MKALQFLGLSQREACSVVRARRRSSREVPSTKVEADKKVALRLTELAQHHEGHGCRRLYSDYERDSVAGDEYMNYKRFRRLYRLAALQIGQRRRRGRAKIVRGRSLRRAVRPFEGWTMDFMHDRLFSSRAFRGLTVMDEFSRLGLALEAAYSFPSRSVVTVLDDLGALYGYPKYLRIDNGTELTSKIMQQWSEEHCVELLFIQPGKPTQNAYIESFNSRVRAEFFNTQWFRSILEVRTAADAWRHSYNTTHAHSALNYLTPEEFLATCETTPIPQESLAA